MKILSPFSEDYSSTASIFFFILSGSFHFTKVSMKNNSKRIEVLSSRCSLNRVQTLFTAMSATSCVLEFPPGDAFDPL